MWYKNKEIMKLELKHLAPYLPYGLKFYWEQLDGTPNKPWTLTINSIEFALENQNKPILHPLSDLTDYVSQSLLDRIENSSSRDLTESLNYNSVCYLLEHHFDVFGLIEKGLAIDINTLNK